MVEVLPIELPLGLYHREIATDFGPTNAFLSTPLLPNGGKRVVVSLEEVAMPVAGIITMNVQWNAKRDATGQWEVSTPAFTATSHQTSAITTVVANGGTGVTEAADVGFFSSVPIMGPCFRISMSALGGSSTEYQASLSVMIVP